MRARPLRGFRLPAAPAAPQALPLFLTMSIDRIKRVNELIKREIAGVLYRVLDGREVDMSAITVTHVMTSRNLRHARILVSIRGHEDEQRRFLDRLRHHRSEIQQLINRDLSLKYTPRLSFELDDSVRRGDDILQILKELPDPDGILDEPDTEDLQISDQ